MDLFEGEIIDREAARRHYVLDDTGFDEVPKKYRKYIASGAERAIHWHRTRSSVRSAGW